MQFLVDEMSCIPFRQSVLGLSLVAITFHMQDEREILGLLEARYAHLSMDVRYKHIEMERQLTPRRIQGSDLVIDVVDVVFVPVVIVERRFAAS